MPSVAVRRRSLPSSLDPQLCTLVPTPPDGADWIHEIKYDGWRLLARKDGTRVRLYTRGGNEARMHYQIFDMPWCNGRDLAARPLLDRKRRLRDAIADAPRRIRYTSHVAGQGQAFFDRVNALDLEGVVSKLANSRYDAGARTRDHSRRRPSTN